MKKIFIILGFSSFLFFQVSFASQYESVQQWVRAGARTEVFKLENKPIDFIEVAWRASRNTHALGQLYLGDYLENENTVGSKYSFPEEIPDYTLTTHFDWLTMEPFKYLQIGIEDENAYIYDIQIHYLEK